MPNSMNIRLAEPIDLGHSFRQRYYQNKTKLRLNFGSVLLGGPAHVYISESNGQNGMQFSITL